MALLVSTVLVFLATFLTAIFVSNFLFRKKYKLPPGPQGWPFLGNILDLAKRPEDFHKYCTELSAKYGPIFQLQMGSEMRMVVLTSAELIRECSVAKADFFSDRALWIWIGKFVRQGEGGVIMRNGDDWQKMRRFGLTALRDFGVGKKSMEGKILEEQEYLQKIIAQHNGRPFDAHYLLNQAVSNVICSVCFGARFEYNDKHFQKLLELINENFRSSAAMREPGNLWKIFRLLPMSKPVKKLVDNFRQMEKWVQDQIDKRREVFDPQSPSNLIDLYLLNELETKDKSNRFTEFEVQRLILDLFLAGTETTSTTLLWGLMFLMQNPEVQARCHDAIDKAIGRERPVSLADKSALPYIEATINEIQRLANITAMGVQHNAHCDAELGGYDIPKDTVVTLLSYGVHMDEKNFPNPEEFQPERFLDASGKYKKNDNFVAFGSGPRVCMGENLAKTELFIFLTSLLQKFKFEKESPETKLDFNGVLGITLAPKDFNLRALIR